VDNCEFCSEFERGYFGVCGIENRVLYESDNFVVFPSLGQIVEGYLLITSKAHYVSMGVIPEQLHAELESVEDKVRTVLRRVYANPLFFEHGPDSERRCAGNCIDHAHFHCVPVDIELIEELSKDFPYEQIFSFRELRNHNSHIPYFFVEKNGQRYIFDIDHDIPSQYIRKIIADKIGKPERRDWAVYPGFNEMKRTIKKLKPEFISS